AAELDRPVATCSVGFHERAYNELPNARRVAERLGCDHHEYTIEPDVRELVPRIVRFFDEPFADSSAIPTYYVSQIARRHVTVALNGDGGDEAFLGYSRYRAMHYLHRLDRLPIAARTALAQLLALAPPSIQRRLRLGQIRDILAASPA